MPQEKNPSTEPEEENIPFRDPLDDNSIFDESSALPPEILEQRVEDLPITPELKAFLKFQLRVQSKMTITHTPWLPADEVRKIESMLPGEAQKIYDDIHAQTAHNRLMDQQKVDLEKLQTEYVYKENRRGQNIFIMGFVFLLVVTVFLFCYDLKTAGSIVAILAAAYGALGAFAATRAITFSKIAQSKSSSKESANN